MPEMQVSVTSDTDVKPRYFGGKDSTSRLASTCVLTIYSRLSIIGNGAVVAVQRRIEWFSFLDLVAHEYLEVGKHSWIATLHVRYAGCCAISFHDPVHADKFTVIRVNFRILQRTIIHSHLYSWYSSLLSTYLLVYYVLKNIHA
jgi:hypothetical protein